MSWIERWSPELRAVAELSRCAPGPGPASCDRDRLVACAVRERTAAIVAHSVDDPRLRALADAVLARQVLALTQAAVLVSRIGPDVIPLKGLHLIETHYRPGERDLGDLDILVRRERAAEADAAIRALGYEAEVAASTVLGATGSCLNSAIYRRGGDFHVHLHWHVVNASLPLSMVRIRAEEIWEESTPGTVAGIPARRMAPHHLLVTLCEHALKHSYDALIHVADIDRAWRAGADADLAFGAARRWGIEPALRWGLYFAKEILGTPVDVRAPAGALERWVARWVREDRRWPGLGAVGYLSMARGWRERAGFVRGSFAPPRRDVEGFGKRAGPWNVARRIWAALRAMRVGAR
ncbi:MAG: nucleotidyltransferase family protein [Planctomycetes bacterium]|nr:nucleotidyltransferase family protein [Planctomycetota bacterium]